MNRLTHHHLFTPPAAPLRRVAGVSGAVGAAALLSACVSLPSLPSLPGWGADKPAEAASKPAAAAAPGTPLQWQAPVPHQGQPTDLLQWWQQFNDPVLLRLQTAAQTVSPTLASARSRIEQARASSVAASAARLPLVDAVGSASTGKGEAGVPRASVAQLAFQSSWEIDLFGAVRAGDQAGLARLDGAQAAWHSARVAVAAETASTYLQLRACEAQVQQLDIDAQSRAETARVTDRSAQAGLTPPAAAAQARASAAQGRAQTVAQRAQCDSLVKALVSLSAEDEAALRRALAERTAQLPQPAAFSLASLPAQLLAQRPDLTEAAAAVTAAAADVKLTEARRFPRVSLSGALGFMGVRADGVSRSGETWSLGPLQVTFPVFDAGIRRANVTAARSAYDEAVAVYQARTRVAVREVEDALVQLRSAADRQADAQTAMEGYEASFKAAESRYKGGISSIFELEDARRTAVAARSAFIELQRERVAAWIALYRALGGGWQATAAVAAAPTPAR
ncbi:MAG: efflux transporter outer membrane subunit [Rubrivivax sp.]|jgi:multidrug efflux system outer membrane protein|nr:efflux transporter outer membrane subunit [Rubrivivax sp.]